MDNLSYPIDRPHVPSSSDDAALDRAAYVLFTSGSTGVPKAVVATHRGVTRLVCNTNFVSVAPDDVYLQLAPLSFDASTFEIWAPLLNGASLAIYPAEAIDLGRLGALVRRHRVSVLWLTTGLFHQVVDQAIELFASVRRVFTGGEVLSPARTAAFLGAHPRLEFANFYGPTEGTTFSTWCHVTAAEERIPIGRPIANTRVYVLDDERNLSPIGVVGEIYVAGDGVARGYFERDDLTDERFVTSEHLPGERLYRTGDRGRWRANGKLDFLGRVDRQVKIRGYRIEPGDVEAALQSYEGVSVAVVIDRARGDGDKWLAAYVVLEPGASFDARACRTVLRARLAEHAIPETIVPVPHIPLTPTGKFDRDALVAIGDRELDAQAAREAPRDALEAEIAQMFREVLGHGRFGVFDSFFEVGGTSLLVMRLRARLKATLDADIAVKDLLENPSIAAIRARIERARGRTLYSGHPTRVVEDGEWVDVSFAQQRMLHTYLVDRPCHSIVIALDVRGPLDEARLERAFQAVLRRHDVLRSAFARRDGVWFQSTVHPFAQPIERIDLTHLPPRQRAYRRDELLAEIANLGFDLGADPLCRAHAIRSARDEHRVVFSFNHLVCDGLSIALFVDELSANYLNDGFDDRDELAFQYADYARWQRHSVKGERLAELARECEAKLEDLPLPLRLRDAPDLSFAYDAAAHVSSWIPAARAALLTEMATALRTTPFVLWITAFKLALATLSGERDVVVGTVYADRVVPEAEQMIGLFSSWVLFRTELPANLAFHEAVRRVDAEVSRARETSDYPYALLEEAVAARGPDHPTAIYNAAINYRPYSPGSIDLDGLEVAVVPVSGGGTRNDFVLDVDESNEGVAVAFTHRVAACDERTAERVLTLVLAALDRIASNEPVGSLADART